MKERPAVYGSGTIGACLATLLIGNGYPTVLIGHSPKGLERCRKTVEQNWDDLIAEGLAKEANKCAALALLTLTQDHAFLHDRTFVFEAVSEDLSVKQSVYQRIEDNAPENTVIASSTSSIDAEVLAEFLRRPERFLIAHPFQPAHMLPLVELISHKGSAPETLTHAQEFLTDVKRQIVVLKKSVPGFLVNRFAQALFRESIYLIEQGVTTVADIDRAIKYAVGMRYASIGLLEYFDAVGFELESTIAQNVYPDLCDIKEVQAIVQAGLAVGKTGQAAGSGLYDWGRIDGDDFRRRQQAPYFPSVKSWKMPE